MTLALIIFGSVHLLITSALTVSYVRNERKNVFVWRRLTRWGRIRHYCTAVLMATFAIILGIIVAVLCIIIPPAPAGTLRKAQDVALHIDERLTPS
ncbi:MAG: hypothetical protein AAB562_04020 [Patescibacteria group bacterium]